MPSIQPVTKNRIGTLLRKRMFHIDAAEVTFSRRGFVPGSAAAQGHLEQIGTSFLSGYHAAIDQGLTTSLAQILSQTDSEYRGFAFEGAGMGLGSTAFRYVEEPGGNDLWTASVVPIDMLSMWDSAGSRRDSPGSDRVPSNSLPTYTPC